MKKIVLRICTVFLFVGVGMGPLYHVYCLYFSGKKVDDQVLCKQDLTRIEFGHFRYADMEHFDAKKIQLELSPDMNPIGLILKGKCVKPRTRAAITYSLALSREEKNVWKTSCTYRHGKAVEPSKKKLSFGKLGLVHFSTVAGSFDVNEPGTYELLVKRKSGGLKVPDLKVVTKARIIKPKPAVFIPGYIFIVVSLVISAVIGGKKKTKSKSRR